jgi:hypothetical protein
VGVPDGVNPRTRRPAVAQVAVEEEPPIQLLFPDLLLGLLQVHSEPAFCSAISGRVIDVQARPKDLRSLQRDAGQTIEVDLPDCNRIG